MTQNPSFMQSYFQGKQQGEQIGRELRAIVRVLMQAGLAIASITSLIAEVFLHQRLGIRYLNLLTATLAMLVIGFCFDITRQGERSFDPLFLFLLMPAFMFACVVQFSLARRAEKKAIRRHSKSNGVPHPFIWKHLKPYGRSLSEHTIESYIEPAALLGLSLVMVIFVGKVSASLVAIAGVSMFVRGYLAAWMLRNDILNHIDQEIEAETFSRALETKTTPALGEDQGFVVPSALMRAITQLDAHDDSRATTPASTQERTTP